MFYDTTTNPSVMDGKFQNNWKKNFVGEEPSFLRTKNDGHLFRAKIILKQKSQNA